MEKNSDILLSRPSKTVLLTGGTGFIGSRLCELLASRGHMVRVLSRSEGSFRWDPKNRHVDSKALENVDALIHLAGAGIADARWTKSRKQVLHSSRVDTISLLRESGLRPQVVITASGINCYGKESSDTVFKEEDAYGSDYLSQLVKDWEAAAYQFKNSRVVCLRTPMVLGDGGAIKKLTTGSWLGINAVPGGGSQWTPWIHIDDLCRAYISTLENESFNGSYNVVADENITLSSLLKAYNESKKTKKIQIPIPGFIIKLALGEMASIVLNGYRADSSRIRVAGFKPLYDKIDAAFRNLSL